MDNKEYKKVVRYLKNGTFPKRMSSRSNFKKAAKKYQLKNDTLYRYGKMVVKNCEKEGIYSKYHTHSGRDICWAKINETFYWRGGKKYVADMTKLCVGCKQKNNPNWPSYKPDLCVIPVVPKLWWRVIIFFIQFSLSQSISLRNTVINTKENIVFFSF